MQQRWHQQHRQHRQPTRGQGQFTIVDGSPEDDPDELKLTLVLQRRAVEPGKEVGFEDGEVSARGA